VCIALCTIVAHNIAQNRPDNFPSYPPDNHHCSDDVYLREALRAVTQKTFSTIQYSTVVSLMKTKTTAKQHGFNSGCPCRVFFIIHVALNL